MTGSVARQHQARDMLQSCSRACRNVLMMVELVRRCSDIKHNALYSDECRTEHVARTMSKHEAASYFVFASQKSDASRFSSMSGKPSRMPRASKRAFVTMAKLFLERRMLHLAFGESAP